MPELAVQSENEELKKMQAFITKQNERIERLERSHYSNLQYQRRDTVEITGIPDSVTQNELKNEVVKIFEAANVIVDGDLLEKNQIQACHRIGKKGVTICKFVNRKYANGGLFNGKNLKNKDIYGGGSKIFINSSFCDEYRHLNYLVRKAKRDNLIYWYKVKNGVNLIKMTEDGDFKEITHKKDLVRLNIVQDSLE